MSLRLFRNNDLPAKDLLREYAQPLADAEDFDALLADIGEAECVLIGEASHGSEEFYLQRALLTQRLIREKGFVAVAVEADWPDSYRVNRYVTGGNDDMQARDALEDFRRFPTWMWRNEVVETFLIWLHDHNATAEPLRQCGFYGLDIYSLQRSAQAVIDYLETVDPPAARRARERYACFGRFEEDMQSYGYAASIGLSPSCEDEVIEQLVELYRNAQNYLDGQQAQDAYFYAERNAAVAERAEAYYRSMFRADVSSWNLRDEHMMDTLQAIRRHLREAHQIPPKVVVWAHNSHVGDARATEVRRHREINLGQLARETYGEDAYLIGFSTYEGTVTAASHWGGEAELKQVRRALRNSYEALLHEADISSYYLFPAHPGALREALMRERLQRAIGVIYRPESERESHYYHACLPQQFDAMIHIDNTTALRPLEKSAGWHQADAYETYPSGL